MENLLATLPSAIKGICMGFAATQISQESP